MRGPSRARLGAPLCLVLLACSGAIEGDAGEAPPAPGGESAGAGGAPPSRPGEAAHPLPGSGGGPADPLAVGPMPLLRLTSEEYDATVRDLLGDTTAPGRAFPEDAEGPGGYAAAGPADVKMVQAYQAAAELLAPAAIARLGTLFPCDTAGGREQACAEAFITGFGKRVYRRPLAPEEIADLRAVYGSARGELGRGHPEALRLVLQTMLQTPFFLYRWELGAQAPRRDGKVVRLGPWEIASRLSYFLWGSMPDAELFAAAESGRLGDPAEIERQARRLLADRRAHPRLASFHAQWLQVQEITTVQKNTRVYPSFTPDLAAAMRDETAAFVGEVMGAGDGKLGTLLGSPVAFLNEALGKLYGVSGPRGATLQRAALDPVQRAGILTRAAFLTTHAATNGSNPVKRGATIFFRLLCGHMPAPPEDVPPVKAPADDVTTRQRFVEHATSPACAACHRILDPLGFAFESFDGIGRHRTHEGPLPVDTRGTLALPRSGSRSYADAREMSAILATAEEVRECVARQWMRFLLGRVERPEDEASLAAAHQAFARADFDVRELLVALTRTRAFLHRSPAPGEVVP